MHDLKLKVHNKARVEGSIVEVHTVQEMTYFFQGTLVTMFVLDGRGLIDTTMEEQKSTMMAAA